MSRHVLEAKLTVRENPQALIGLYYFSIMRAIENGTEQITVYGNNKAVVEEKLREKGIESPKIIRIEDIDHAVSLTPNSEKEVIIERPHIDWSDVRDLIRGELPNDYIIGGLARLWKETRYPFNWLYFLSKGKFLGQKDVVEDARLKNNADITSGVRQTTGMYLNLSGIKFLNTSTTSRLYGDMPKRKNSDE